MNDPGDKVNLLLVDDRRGNLLALAGVLDNPGYELVLAESGEAALREMLRRDFALVLLDVAMPGMDGFETAALIKSRPRSAMTPIIFVTATAEEENLAKGYSAGAVDFLRKPLDPFTVQSKVAVFVELFRQRRKIERQSALLRAKESQARDLQLAQIRLATEARYRNRLATQLEVLSRLTADRPLEEAAGEILEAICAHLDWDVGALWDRGGPGGAFRRLAAWTAPDAELAPGSEDRAGLDEAWERRGPVLRDEADTLGKGRCVLWSPILRGESPIAVLELRSTARHGPEDLTAIATIGVQLGFFARRTEMAASLRASEEHLSTILRSIGEAVIATDEKGRVDFMNPVAESLTGWSEDQARGIPLEQVFRRVDEETGEPLRSPAASGPHAGAVSLVRRDGSWLAIEESASPIRDAKGAQRGGVRVFRDATERRRTALRRRLSEEASKVLYRSLDYRKTLESLARLAVPCLGEWCAVRMFETDEVPSTAALEHEAPNRLEWLDEARRELEQSPAWEAFFRRAVADGKTLCLHGAPEEVIAKAAPDESVAKRLSELGSGALSVVPLVARGGLLGVIAFGSSEGRRRNCETDLALAEDLAGRAATAIENALLYGESRAAVRMRDEFLSIASHELRTPLSSLQLQLQSLRRLMNGQPPADPERVPGKLETALRQTRRVAGLIDGLLDVSRIASGRLEMRREPVDLAALVREAAERFHEEAARAGCTLEVHAERGAMGHWDPARLEQVLLNLLSNAVKYAAGKPVEVTVEARGDEARLTVRDRGIGISSEDVNRIFGLFERAVSLRHYGGLGVGLFIVRQIVEAHGGRIEVESEPGEGSTFTVILPRALTVTEHVEEACAS